MKINIGDHVIVRPSFGMGAGIEVEVETLDEKNGRPLFGYTVPGSDRDHRWAYLTQIDRVTRHAGESK